MISCKKITTIDYAFGELLIEYGSCHSPFGNCFIATTNQGICKVAFFDTDVEKNLIKQELNVEWQNAGFVNNEVKIKSIGEAIFLSKKDWKKPLKLLLKGSPFQLKVWEALLAIPEATLVAYQEIASNIDNSKAVRAVASAIAQNKVAYLVPCHRVIRKNGAVGQYRWGNYRKQELIAWEVGKSRIFSHSKKINWDAK